MTQQNSTHVHSVWSLTVEPVPFGSTCKVELEAETIKKVAAEIESRVSNQARFNEPALNIEALRTLYT